MPLELWSSLVEQLPGRRLIAVDMPGCGGSSARRTPVSMVGFAALAGRLLECLDVERADVLGLSFGGMVAQQFAVSAPRRVRRLVLASTSCGWGAVPGSPLAALSALTADRSRSRRLFESLAPFSMGGGEGTDIRFLRRQSAVRTARPPHPHSYLRQVGAAAMWSSLPWLPLLRQPTLVLAGTADPLVPWGNAALLTALLPADTCHLVRGGGHLCLLARAAELGPVVTAFLDR
jgi:poly(3-hydroxyoctanoate) depolymerase